MTKNTSDKIKKLFIKEEILKKKKNCKIWLNYWFWLNIRYFISSKSNWFFLFLELVESESKWTQRVGKIEI
jgi:hypothetical protein